ncbi:arsenic transporter [Acidithiobacillus sp. IBUN Pt1247-S3]|uniref:arsenic transporter n=1 Tax=Acidithiobacillus sp. IBUN Pt1247-S3 TaxID=3166642 RepID=UPI0034E582B2
MLALGIFLLTLILVIWQPRGLSIGWSAMGGALLALATGAIQWRDIPIVWGITWDATFTFVALIIISLILDEAGFFHWAALHVARWGRGHGRRLFPLIILLGALIAAVFANDGAALLLTPIVLAILLQLEFSPAATFAFVIATGFVADTTSLPLMISNLVNIVSANYFDISFDRYALVMVPVDIVAFLVTLLVLRLAFRQQIPVQYGTAHLPEPRSAIRDPLVFRASFPVLLLLLLAYFITAQWQVPVSLVTVTGALILLTVAGRWWRGGAGAALSVRKILREAPWKIVVFVLGMYLVVYGLRNAGLTDLVAEALQWLAGQGLITATLGTGFIAAVLSSVMNNMPAVLVGALSIHHTGLIHTSPRIHEAMVYANVIGCDLGPKFTPIGSLATLLWLHVLDRKGVHIGWGQYMKTGLLLTPPVLIITLLALSGWLSCL